MFLRIQMAQNLAGRRTALVLLGNMQLHYAQTYRKKLEETEML